MDLGDFLNQVIQQIQAMGGLPWVGKIAAIIMLVISAMKVTVLKQWVWDRWSGFQAWVAPILGLVAGVLSLGVSGQLTLSGVFAYLSAGAGAVILHELLDTVKVIPGIGPIWVSLINMVEGALNPPQDPPAPSA